MKEWKYAVKYENLLQFFTEEEGITLNLDQAYKLIGWPVLDKFDSYQEAIESLKEYGKEILQDLENLTEDQTKAFMKIVDENVEISTVSIIGKLKLMNTDGDGVKKIKDTLMEAKQVIEKPKETRNIKISYIGAPFYRVEVVSKDYLDAENILSDSLEIIESMSKEYNSTYEFIRD
jgi:translation initiation factor 2 subunit 1